MPMPQPQDNSKQHEYIKALAAAARKSDFHAQAVQRWMELESRGKIRGDYHSHPGVLEAFVQRASARLRMDFAKKAKLHQKFLRSQSHLKHVPEDTLSKDFLDVLIHAFYKGMLPSALLANQLITDMTYGKLVSLQGTFEPATQDRPWHLFPSRQFVETRIKEEKV